MRYRTLQTIDNGVVADEDLDHIGRLPVPDEELPVIRAGHHKLSAVAEEVGLLDIGGGVAGAHVPAAVVPGPPPPHQLLDT